MSKWLQRQTERIGSTGQTGPCCVVCMSREIPPQEQVRKWFRSHLLGREVELQDLYELPQSELDLLMAETAEIRSDTENRARSHGRWCTAGYMLQLARIIDTRRAGL